MGGREFGAATKSGIAREDVAPTMAYLARIAGVDSSDLIALGSAGKKARSGDIDVAIDSSRVSPEKYDALVKRVAAALGEEHSIYRPGFKTYSFAVPICGDPAKGRVQVDFKYNDGEFLRFSHFSAEGERSAYKGAVRTVLLASLAASLHTKGEDAKVKEDGRTVVDVRWGLDVNAGLKRIFRMCPRKKRGEGRVRNLEDATPAEIHAEFPDLKFKSGAKVITDPAAIVRKLFGPGVKPQDVESAEDVIKLIAAKHPSLVEKGFFTRAGKKLPEMNVPIPPELGGKAPAASGNPVHAPELVAGSLPKAELEWRTFRSTGKGKSKIWAIAVEPDGESFRVRQGIEGGTIIESKEPIRPGESGVRGKTTYVSAEEACRREVGRRVQLRLHGGFVEDGAAAAERKTAASPAIESAIDFSVPLPKNIVTPKPREEIKESEFRRLHSAGLARITRKYDGVGLIVVHHTYGWETYTLQGHRLTEFFPKHIEALNQTGIPVGSMLKAEATFFKRDNPFKDDIMVVNSAMGTNRDPADVRRDIDSGLFVEPSFVFYDTLFLGGKALSDVTYDDRAKTWRGFPVARGGAGLLTAAEYYDVTPDTWRDARLELGIEGFVVVDGASTLGSKVISFGGSAPRPKGNYKLKPNRQDDVVLYAVREVDGKLESVFVKQIYPECYPDSDIPHPRAGQWFASGRVSTHQMVDVIAKLRTLISDGTIKVVASNKEGEQLPVDNNAGVVAVIEFFDRFPSNKFRHAKFVQPARFRDVGADLKRPEDCVTQFLGEVTPGEESAVAAAAPVRTKSRKGGHAAA